MFTILLLTVFSSLFIPDSAIKQIIMNFIQAFSPCMPCGRWNVELLRCLFVELLAG